MIDLANPKTPLESAKIAGYLTVMSGLGGKCPYPVGDDFYIAYKEGVALAQSLPKPKKGEIFTLGHYSGVSCTVCFDDLTIGDPVVLICKMYGLLVHSALYKPSVVKGVITRVMGERKESLFMLRMSSKQTSFRYRRCAEQEIKHLP